MYIGKRLCFKIVSCILTFSFLITGPSNASITDALKPPKSDSNEILQLGDDVSRAPQFSITDPEKIIIAENMGRVREIFKGNNGKLIINIQDAHCNFEAQTNICQILDVLVSHGLRIVALEGSSGEIDPSIFTTYPDEEIRKEVAAYFLKKGKINGAEYLAITSKNPPELYGVETKEYYLANLATFLNTLKERDKIKTACSGVKSALEKLKDRIYSKELKAMDERAIINTNDETKLADYCWFLKQMAESKKVPIDRFPDLMLLYKTVDIEKTIDFGKVADERANVISALENSLTQKELEELFSKSVGFKAGRITATMYHVYLRRMALEKNADYAKYPNLNLYTDYLLIYDKINTPALFKELVELENDIKEKLFTNQDQRDLDRLSRNIRLLENMFDISMSKEDVDYYQQNKKDFTSAAFTDFINRQTKRYKIPAEYSADFALVDKYLPDLENFYRIAETRDDAILENTLKKMDEENVPVVALITGGYHTQGIAERLRERGISYVIIAPRITKAEKDSPYLSILSSEKVPAYADLKTDSKNLAVNSGLERNGGLGGTDEAEFAIAIHEAFRHAEENRRAETLIATATTFESSAVVSGPTRLELAQQVTFNDPIPGPGMVFDMDAIESDIAEPSSLRTVTGFTYAGETDSAEGKKLELEVRAGRSFDLPADAFDAAEDLVEWHTSGVPVDAPGRELKLRDLRVLEQYLAIEPKELIRRLRSGEDVPALCLAALMEKGFYAQCAHRGDVKSRKPYPTIPVNMDELEKAIDHMISHRLDVTLNAVNAKDRKRVARPAPIYLIPEGEMREWTSEGTRFMRVTFRASEGLNAGRPMTFEVRVPATGPAAVYRIEGPADNETATPVAMSAQNISRVREIMEGCFSAKRDHAQANAAQVQATAVRSLKKTAAENAKFELEGLRRKLESGTGVEADIRREIAACEERKRSADQEARTAEDAYKAANEALRAALGKVEGAKAKGFPNLHRLLIGRGEYRENLLAAYLGGAGAIAFSSGMFWNLKRTENLLAILQDPSLQNRLRTLALKLQGFARIEEKTFNNADASIFSSQNTDIINQALVSLSDMGWAIQEALKAVNGIEDLSGRRRQDLLSDVPGISGVLGIQGIPSHPAAAFTLPQPVSRQLAYANTILERMDAVMDSIDYQMETRGRDSLGFAGTFTFKNRVAYEEFLRLLEGVQRLESDTRGLTAGEKNRLAALIAQLNERLTAAENKNEQERIETQIGELQRILSGKQRLEIIMERLTAEHELAVGQEKPDIAHRIEQLRQIIAAGTLKDELLFRAQGIRDMTNLSIRLSEPAQDPDAPVSVTFIYKTAERVGRLGDNVARIREDIKSDRLLRILLGLDEEINAFTLVSHTRWASCGTISEPNCHPVDSEGVYQYSDRAAAERQIYKFIHPRYPGNDITIAVLNGDITNYAELRRRYEETDGAFRRHISPQITTDTKVIPIVIESYLAQGYSLEEAVWLAGREFEGSFAIQVSSHLEPGKMYLLQAGEGQELNIGISRDGFHPASEVYGFVRETQQYVKLKPEPGEGIVAVIDNNLEPWAENIRYSKFTMTHKAMPTVEANRALQDLQAAVQAPLRRAARLRQDAGIMAKLLTENIGAIPERLRPEILLATAAAIQQASILSAPQDLDPLRDTIRGLIQGVYGTYTAGSSEQLTLDQALSLLNNHPIHLSLEALSDSLGATVDQLIAARAQMVTADFATNLHRLAAYASIISTLGSMRGALSEAAQAPLSDTISDISEKLTSYTNQLCACGLAGTLSPELTRAGVRYLYAASGCLISLAGPAGYPAAYPEEQLIHAGFEQYLPERGAPAPSISEAVNEMAKHTMVVNHFTSKNMERTPLTGRDTYLPKGFAHYLFKELNQGPKMLQDTCRGKIGIRTEGAREIPEINVDASTLPPAFIEKILSGKVGRVIFAGMGTADTAAGASAEILRSQLIALNDILRENGMPPVVIETFSELATNASAFDIKEDMSDTLIVAISQSGGTTDTNTYLSKASPSLERAAGRGALLLGIINKRDSDMDNTIRNVRDQYGNPAGGVIYTGTGRDVEIAVASTKAFYAQIAAASIICMKIMRELAKKYDQERPGRHILERFDALLVEDIRELQALPAKMRSLLDAIKDMPDHTVRMAARTAALECVEWVIMGGGPGYFAAKEGRIKLGELCFKSFQELFFSGDALPRRMLNKTWVVVNGAGVHGRHMRFVNHTPEETLKMLEAGATVTFVTEEGDTRYDDPRFAVYRNGLVNLASFKGAELQPLLDTLRRTGFGTLRFDMTAVASADNLVHALHSQLENRLSEQEARNIVSGLAAWRRLTNGDLAATCERIRSIAGYNDLDFDPAASGATGLGLIEALCAQKGISLTDAQRLVHDSHPVRLHIVKVPRCTEHFATILNTVVDHALGYYGAVAINDRAVRLGQGQFGNVIRDMLGGQFNTGFPPEFSTRFALLHMAAEGRLKVEDLNRILGTTYRSRAEVVRALQDFVQKCRDHSARGIDAVLHQAKFVTVGATRQGFELRIGSVINQAIKPQSDHALFHGADRLMLRSLYMLYSQDLKTQVQIVPVSDGKARVFVVCQNRAGVTDDIEAAMRQAGCAVTGRDKLEFDIPSSESIMQVFDIPISADRARSQGLEDAIVRGLIGRRLEALASEGVQYHGPKEAVPLAVETVANSTISVSASLTPEIKLSNAQLPSSAREQIASGKIRRVIFVGDGVARSAGEAAKNTMEGYIRDIRNLLVKESGERAASLAKYDIHVEVSSMTAVQMETFGMTEDMSDALVIGIAGDRQTHELLRCMDSAQGHGAQLLAITQDGNAKHDPLRAFIAVRKGGVMEVQDSGEGLYAPLAALSVYNMELARLFTESVCVSAKRDSGMELRLAGRMEAVIVDDIVELRHAMPDKLRRFLAAAQEKATPAARAVDQAAQFWPHRKMDWKLLGDGPGYAVGQFGRELVAKRCGKATEGDFVENYKHKDTSTESFVILLTANVRGTGDNYNLDVLNELEKWRAHESFVVIICTEGDRRFENFGIPLISATGEILEKISPFPVIPVPQTSERFSGFLLGLATDTVTESIAGLMEWRVDQLRAAKRALLAIADPKETTPEKLGERAFVKALTTKCGPILADMSKGMYNAYLPTELAARFTGLYVLLSRIMTIEDAAEYTGRDYANTGGIAVAYRDFCALIDRMVDTMSMRAVLPMPTAPPTPPIPIMPPPTAPLDQKVRYALDTRGVSILGIEETPLSTDPEAIQVFEAIGGIAIVMRDNTRAYGVVTNALAGGEIGIEKIDSVKFSDGTKNPPMLLVVTTNASVPPPVLDAIRTGLQALAAPAGGPRRREIADVIRPMPPEMISSDPAAVQVFASPEGFEGWDEAANKPGVVIVMQDAPEAPGVIQQIITRYGFTISDDKVELISDGTLKAFQFVLRDAVQPATPSLDNRLKMMAVDIRKALSLPQEVRVIPGCERPSMATIQAQAPLAEGIGHAGLLFADSGIVGLAAESGMPSGDIMLLRDYLRSEFMVNNFGPVSLQVLQHNLGLDTITPESHRIYFGENEREGVYAGLADGIRPALQNTRGCLMWAVAGPTVKTLREPPARCSTDVLAVHIPRREELTDEEIALLTPNRNFEDGSAELLETLLFVAAKNGIDAGTLTHPNLNRLSICVTARDREEDRRGYLRQLEQYGLEIVEISSAVSPISDILEACLPPRPDGRLKLFLGGAGTPQTIAAIHFAHGMRNGWVAANILSNHVNDTDQSAAAQTPAYKGLGKRRARALAFDNQEQPGISRFIAACGELSHAPTADDIMQSSRSLTVRLLDGQPPSRGVLIPVSGDPVLCDSVTGELLPGIEKTDNKSEYTTFNVSAGSGWTQTHIVRTPELPRQARFERAAFDAWYREKGTMSIDAEADARQETKSRIQTSSPRPTSDAPGYAIVNGLVVSEAVRAATRRRIQELSDRGVIIEGDENSLVIGENVYVEAGAVIKKGAQLTGVSWVCKGAIVSGYVHDSFVGEKALIERGSAVFNSVLEEGVKCYGTVQNALVHRNATISLLARVVTEPARHEEWELSPYMHKVESHRAEIGEGSVIEGVVENARIGKNCRLLACQDAQKRLWRPYISDGSIGDNNNVAGAVRIWLANLANNHLIGNFTGEFDRNDFKADKLTMTGPLEITDFSEDPVYSGMLFGQAGRGPEFYVEYIEGFYLPLTTMTPTGSYRYWDTPGRFTQGRNSMAMEFSGMLKPQAETIKAITGKETSGHGILAMFPFAVIAANAKLIGAPDFWDRENVRTPGDVMDRYDRTFIGSFAVLMPGCEGWGRVGAFSMRRGLSILQEEIGGVLVRAPGVIRDQLMALPEAERKKLDGIVEALIATEIQQLRVQLGILERKAAILRSLPRFRDNREKLERTEERVNQLKEGIELLRQQAEATVPGSETKVWEFKDGEFKAPWERAADGTHSCPGWPHPAAEKQYTLGDLLKETAGKEYPVRTMKSPFNAEQYAHIEEMVRNGSVIVEGGAQVHPKAVLLPGTVVRKGTTVEEGAVLRGVEVPSGTVVHKNAEVSLCVIEGPRSIGEGARVNMMRINADIGNAVVGIMAYNDSAIGKKSILRPYSGVGEGSDIGPNCTVGGLVNHTDWTGGNIRNEHLATDIDYENIPPLAIEVTDGAGTVHKATLNPPVTHGAGTLIQGTADAPVTAVAAFFAGMGIIKKGASVMAAFTKMGLDEGEQLGWFTRSDGPGAEKKSIGGLLGMLSYMMRHEMSYTVKVTPKQDRWAVGYMVESLIVRALEENIVPLLGDDPLADKVRVLVGIVREDFKYMSTNSSALRPQIIRAITEIGQILVEREEAGIIDAGQKRLLTGLYIYATRLDGRFRARYDAAADRLVFTEGEMKYYKEDAVVDERYVDAGIYLWMPNGRVLTNTHQADDEILAAI